MDIFFIASSRIPTERAMGTAIMKQAEAFAKVGNTVTVLVPKRQNDHTDDPFDFHGVQRIFEIRYLPTFDIRLLGTSALRFLIQKVTFILSVQYYVLRHHVHVLYSREPQLLGVLISTAQKVIELHHLYGLRYFGKFFLRRSMRIITITEGLRSDVSEIFQIPATEILLAPSGVTVRQFTKEVPQTLARKKLGVMTHKPVAAYIGALEVWKGYRTFLEASVLLKEHVHFVIIGGTRDEVAREEAVYPHVQFLGSMPQKDLAMNQRIADVLVVPNSGTTVMSSRYTSPLKVLAHMASGVPIVASKIPSLEEMLSVQTAYFVTPDSPEALAHGIETVLNETQKYSLVAKRAQEEVQKYDWSVRTANIMEFLEKMPSSSNL